MNTADRDIQSPCLSTSGQCTNLFTYLAKKQNKTNNKKTHTSAVDVCGWKQTLQKAPKTWRKCGALLPAAESLFSVMNQLPTIFLIWLSTLANPFVCFLFYGN